MSLTVGLTGGIGSGKSAVAKLFSVFGCPVYNSDLRAKEMYGLEKVKHQVTDLLGTKAYDMNGKLDRKFVADKLFSDEKLRQQINAIIHPAVAEDMERFVKEHASHKLIIKESALLFEANLADRMDKIVLVKAPLELKIRRVQVRDGITEQEVRARIGSQWPDEAKTAKSDFVIVNDEVQAVIPQALAIYKELLHA